MEQATILVLEICCVAACIYLATMIWLFFRDGQLNEKTSDGVGTWKSRCYPKEWFHGKMYYKKVGEYTIITLTYDGTGQPPLGRPTVTFRIDLTKNSWWHPIKVTPNDKQVFKYSFRSIGMADHGEFVFSSSTAVKSQ